MSRAVCRDDFQPGITWGEPAWVRTNFSIDGFGWKLLFLKWHKGGMYKWRIFFSILNHLLQAYIVLCTSLLFKEKIDRFYCHATKKYIGDRPVEEAKKMKCYKRLIYKQFFQVSGLCGPQFLSYLPKRFTHLCRALYGDAILVYHFDPPIWPPEINKNIWSSLFL